MGIYRKGILRLGSIAIVVALLDQLTKEIVTRFLEYGASVPVVDNFFNLVLVYNRGAAFGMFAGVEDGTRQILLWSATLIALGVVFFFLFRDYTDDLPAQCALGLIVGGAIGNIIDRIRLGHVIDFLDFYWRQYHWPAFNLADSAICIGVFLILIRSSRPAASKSQDSMAGN